MRIEGVIAQVELEAGRDIRHRRLWLIAIRWLGSGGRLCLNTMSAEQAVVANHMMGDRFGELLRLAERVN